MLYMPSHTQADINRCAVTICIRYPPHYPRQPVKLHLDKAQGLPSDWAHQAATQLQQAAAEYAAAGEVCVFNLVEQCQELLLACNHEEVRV